MTETHPMASSHPITPPPELVQQWFQEWNCDLSIEEEDSDIYVATCAAQWGADQELEACCEWLGSGGYAGTCFSLRAARRPKPPSLKEQALKALDAVHSFGNEGDRDAIRRALEQLDD
jgi:hypothetical protein